MKTPLIPNPPSREAKIDARCSPDLKTKLQQIAAMREIDLSDLIREALREKVGRYFNSPGAVSA